jgi:peptidoglycan/xylan/chitin deacetylase (PgdA/CDA1 family)
MSPRALILTYHAIEAGPAPLCIEASRFRDHLDVIAGSRLRVVSLDELVEDHAEPAVALTFDDGFASAVEQGLPLLAERGMPATIFCVAGHLGGFNDFPTQSQGAPRLPLASADALAAAVENRIELGAHGMEHQPLSNAGDAALRDEIVGSKRTLEDAVGTPVRWFGYPYGAPPRASGRALVERAYAGACGGGNRPVSAGSDRFALPRIDAHYLRRPSRLQATLEGRGLYLNLRRSGARIRRAIRPDFVSR